ncbi:hypothetical protein CF392_12665 [Tamilnaduibacter salinus]|uniref:Polyketide cyclase/dehydrase/lipid transport protein n=1 Tax=Tamilnaduibacter salinus TaxID=1484056 RepID=A0A2A2I112_9GAMM|nr:hypothetical protein [Tamilnaduibacter salinus]PAV25098.1 hypothetical protein CF392_12665 [Tamilnaduibacter salinus]
MHWKTGWMKWLLFAVVVMGLVLWMGTQPRSVDVTESVIVDGDRAAIWQAVTDFDGVFHKSNPAHLETRFDTSSGGLFRDGTSFRQTELVGGFRGNLDGVVLDVYEGRRYAWRADTTYTVAGIPVTRVDEGGVLRIEKTRQGKGWMLSHRVYGRFPDTFKGRVLSWVMSAVFDIEADAARHTLTELEYIKRLVEGNGHG